MARPVIGITANLEEVAFGAWHEPSAFVPCSYVEAVQRAGGLVLILAPDGESAEDPGQLVGLLDGLVLSGGMDIDPGAYGSEAHAATGQTNAGRDAFELALTRAALAQDLPVLGICRGMQLLNVARGGTLHQHLPELLGTEEHRRRPGTFAGNDHAVTLDPGSLAERAAGESEHPTKSHHHQAVAQVGAGLEVTGRAQDGTVEAIELPGARWCLGVQWHPEADEASRVVGELVAAARGRLSPAAAPAA